MKSKIENALWAATEAAVSDMNNPNSGLYVDGRATCQYYNILEGLDALPKVIEYIAELAAMYDKARLRALNARGEYLRHLEERMERLRCYAEDALNDPVVVAACYHCPPKGLINEVMPR